jgi:hypothetical protein
MRGAGEEGGNDPRQRCFDKLSMTNGETWERENDGFLRSSSWQDGRGEWVRKTNPSFWEGVWGSTIEAVGLGTKSLVKKHWFFAKRTQIWVKIA